MVNNVTDRAASVQRHNQQSLVQRATTTQVTGDLVKLSGNSNSASEDLSLKWKPKMKSSLPAGDSQKTAEPEQDGTSEGADSNGNSSSPASRPWRPDFPPQHPEPPISQLDWIAQLQRSEQD